MLPTKIILYHEKKWYQNKYGVKKSHKDMCGYDNLYSVTEAKQNFLDKCNKKNISISAVKKWHLYKCGEKDYTSAEKEMCSCKYSEENPLLG